MQEHIRRWALAARERLAPLGIAITGARWYRAAQGQRKRDSLFVCLEAVTTNANFFGYTYVNRRRGRLIELAYEVNFSMPGGPIPAEELILDIRLSPYVILEASTPLATTEVKEGVVDVTVDHDVKFVRIDDLVNRGEVQVGTMLDDYCQQYHLPHVLMHGRHFISPDSASVELLKALMATSKVRSVLEFGAGVGICGIAAEKHGITDFTFVDISPTVCGYVQARCPKYQVVNADALEFEIKRPYDVVLLGLPYELNHEFLEIQGEKLSTRATTVIFQSGCRCFFDWEHDWLMGSSMARWPWFRKEQTLGHYFNDTLELTFDWQLAVVGSQNRVIFEALRNSQDRTRRYWQDERLTL